MPDSLHVWRKECGTQEDISRQLLDRAGIWGCVMAAVLVANIAQ
jgi:hypothetical protein